MRPPARHSGGFPGDFSQTPPSFSDTLEIHHAAAIDHDGLAGHEAAGPAAEEDGRPGDLVGLADPAQRIALGRLLGDLRVLPQSTGEIGLDQARPDAFGAHVLRPPFSRAVAAAPYGKA